MISSPQNQFHYANKISIDRSQPMESTSVNKCSSLIAHSLHADIAIGDFRGHDDHLHREDICEMLHNIEEINIAKSIREHSLMDEQDNTMESIRANKASFEEESSEDMMTYNSEKKKSYDKCKSLIFSYSPFSKNKLSPTPLSQFQIKVYYFNLPMFKLVPYEKYSKISDIITSALICYSADASFDQRKISQSQYFQCFQVRLPMSDSEHQADLSIEAISYERVLSENMFDALVLLAKPQTQKKGKVPASRLSTLNLKINQITIDLMNEDEDEIGQFSFSKNDQISAIYEFIKENNLCSSKNFTLQQSYYDTFDLPKDFQMKHLTSNKIYIKIKKYFDDAGLQDSRKPIRSVSLSANDSQVIIKMPIGLTEASKYQDFQVLKINSIGLGQQRIFGIDQTKIYNYQKQVRTQKKQPSFLRKIFGADRVTGTKRPFRLIADVKAAERLKSGFAITFSDKKIEYRVKNEEVCQKIWRKLAFLINYSKNQQSKSIDSAHKI